MHMRLPSRLFICFYGVPCYARVHALILPLSKHYAICLHTFQSASSCMHGVVIITTYDQGRQLGTHRRWMQAHLAVLLCAFFHIYSILSKYVCMYVALRHTLPWSDTQSSSCMQQCIALLEVCALCSTSLNSAWRLRNSHKHFRQFWTGI